MDGALAALSLPPSLRLRPLRNLVITPFRPMEEKKRKLEDWLFRSARPPSIPKGRSKTVNLRLPEINIKVAYLTWF